MWSRRTRLLRELPGDGRSLDTLLDRFYLERGIGHLTDDLELDPFELDLVLPKLQPRPLVGSLVRAPTQRIAHLHLDAPERVVRPDDVADRVPVATRDHRSATLQNLLERAPGRQTSKFSPCAFRAMAACGSLPPATIRIRRGSWSGVPGAVLTDRPTLVGRTGVGIRSEAGVGVMDLEPATYSMSQLQ